MSGEHQTSMLKLFGHDNADGRVGGQLEIHARGKENRRLQGNQTGRPHSSRHSSGLPSGDMRVSYVKLRLDLTRRPYCSAPSESRYPSESSPSPNTLRSKCALGSFFFLVFDSLHHTSRGGGHGRRDQQSSGETRVVGRNLQ